MHNAAGSSEPQPQNPALTFTSPETWVCQQNSGVEISIDRWISGLTD